MEINTDETKARRATRGGVESGWVDGMRIENWAVLLSLARLNIAIRAVVGTRYRLMSDYGQKSLSVSRT